MDSTTRKWEGEELTAHLVELDPVRDAKEYQDVQNQFRKTCKSEVMILKKAQVQNPALYRTFTLQKQRMEGEEEAKNRDFSLESQEANAST